MNLPRQDPPKPKPGWDDDDDWGRPPRRIDPATLPPVKPPMRPNVVQWMYILAAVLILAQILYFYLGN
jgi:hypothetical protein